MIFRTFFAIPLAVLLLLAPNHTASAGDPVIKPAGKGIVSIYGGASRASSYFNTAGRMKRFDTLQTELGVLTFALAMNYSLNDWLELNVDVPISYYSLTSNDRFPDRSIFAPAYYGVGATYQLSNGNVNSSISTMVKIPQGFHQGIYDDPKHPTFLSDGYFQALAALNFGFEYKELWFKGSAGYNWRDEEPLDEILYNAEVGFSKVEGTGIFVGFNGVLSTGDVAQPLRPFYAGASGSVTEQQQIDGGTGRFSTIDREEYFAINAGAFVGVSDRVVLSGKYIIRLVGANALVLQGGYLGVGYNF